MTRKSAVCCGRAVLFGLIAVIFLSSPLAAPARAADPIRIGIVYSITGPAGFIGSAQRDSVIAVVDEVNRQGGLLGGRKIELFVEDDRTNPTESVVAVSKLVRDKKVCVVVGPTLMDSGFAMVPTVEQEKVAFIVTSPVPALNKKWVFHTGAGNARETLKTFEFTARTIGAKRIALFTTADANGQMARDTILKEAKKYPGLTITERKAEPADTTVIPQLSAIKAEKPDAVLTCISANLAIIFAKNYEQLGMTTPVVHVQGITSPEFLKNGGKVAEEHKWIMFAQFINVAEKYPADYPLRKNVYEPFKKALQAKFGPSALPTLFHCTSYDGIRAAIEAIKLAGSDDRAAVRNALERTRFEGFLGQFAPTATDHQASPQAGSVPTVIKNGELYPWQK